MPPRRHFSPRLPFSGLLLVFFPTTLTSPCASFFTWFPPEFQVRPQHLLITTLLITLFAFSGSLLQGCFPLFPLRDLHWISPFFHDGRNTTTTKQDFSICATTVVAPDSLAWVTCFLRRFYYRNFVLLTSRTLIPTRLAPSQGDSLFALFPFSPRQCALFLRPMLFL